MSQTYLLSIKIIFYFIIFCSFQGFTQIPIFQTINKVIPFQQDSLWGLKDTSTSQIIVPPKYQETVYFIIVYEKKDTNIITETNFLVKLNKKYGFIDKTGKQIVPFIYDYVESECWERNRRAMVFKGTLGGEYNTPKEGLFGFINPEGKEVIPLIYKEAQIFFNGYTYVKKDSLFAFIDTSGKLITPFKYQDANIFCKEGYARVMNNGKFGVIDTTGNEIISCKYDWIHGYDNMMLSINYGLFTAKKNEESVLINTKGKEVLSTFYEYKIPVCENLIAVADTKKKWGFRNFSDKEIVPCKYDFINIYYIDSFIWVFVGKCDDYFSAGIGKWGLINIEGKEIVEPKYDEYRNFQEGLATVYQNGKWGYIDKTGKVIIEFKFDEAESFENGKAKVTIDNNVKIIDKSGKEVLP